MPPENLPEDSSLTIDEASLSALAELDQAKLVEAAFGSVVADQPELGSQVDNYIGLVGRDATEKKYMKTAVVLVCSFLESQAVTDRQLAQTNDALPDRNGILFPEYTDRKPDDSLLPIVDNAIKHLTLSKLSAQPGLIETTYWQVLQKQPLLSFHIESGRDAAEKERIKEMMAIPYLMIEAQAEVDMMQPPAQTTSE